MNALVTQLEKGCYVYYVDPFLSKERYKFSDGRPYFMGPLVEQEGEYTTSLCNSQGTVVHEAISLKNLWHVGQDHSKCKR